MARQNQQPYFPHEAGTFNRTKMTRLRMQCGPAGYGVYYMLLERLRVEETFSAELDFEVLSFDLSCERDLIRSVIEDFGLFEILKDENRFHSPELTAQMNEMLERRQRRIEIARKAAESRWHAQRCQALPDLQLGSETEPKVQTGVLPFCCEESKPVLNDTPDYAALANECTVMKHDKVWAKTIGEEFKLTVEQLEDKFEEFRKSCIANGKTSHHDLVDAKNHFRNYLRSSEEKKQTAVSKPVNKESKTSPVTERLSEKETRRLAAADRSREAAKKEAAENAKQPQTWDNHCRNKGFEPCSFVELHTRMDTMPPTHPEWIGRFPGSETLEEVESKIKDETAHAS